MLNPMAEPASTWTPSPVEAALSDGSQIRTDGHRAEIVGPDGTVMVRYEAGSATIVASGDLRMAAPEGAIQIEARDGISMTTDGALRQDVGELDVRARVGRVAIGMASAFVRSLETTGTHAVQRFERYEVDATRIVEKARDVLREVEDVTETRAGRMRLIVRGLTSMASKRTSIQSEEDTSIDGRRVLLG